MTMDEPIDWLPLGSVSVQKYEVYTLNWENDTLDASTLVAAPNAGTIAITSAQSFGSEAKDNSAIRLYRQDGNFIAKIELPSFSLLYFAWTSVTRLLCVSTTGRVLVYSSQGKRKPECSFNMGREALEMGIESCQVFRCQKGKTGLAVLCKTGRFYLTNDCEEVTLWRTREVMGKAASPNCWTVLSKDEQTKVFCAFGNEVYILSREFPSEHVVLPFPTVVKSYTALSISPDKLKVALLSGEGLVQVCSSSFTDIYCEFYSAVGPNVRYFLWCGNEAIFISDSSQCTFTGLDNESLSFSFDSSHAVCQEVDGIRVFSARSHEFFSLVHPSLSQIFSVGSLSPAAFLFIAYMEYTKKNYNAYEYVRMIQNQMHEAVLKCIEGAENSFDPPTQKKLLRAASFGKVFAPDAEVARYTSTCRILRMLNNLRQARCAIPLTYCQFQDLTFAGLIEYLVERGEYSIAVACSRCLRVSEEEGVNRVVMHWATENVRNESLSDDLIVSQIRAKSAEFPNLSKAAIAEIAVKFKRTELAAKLLNYEGNLACQVLMLMTLGQKEKALARAAQSKDPELIYFVILKLISSMQRLCDFDLLIRNFEIPFTLYKLVSIANSVFPRVKNKEVLSTSFQYIREDNPQQLKYVFEETDDFLGQAEYHLKCCIEQSLFDVTGKIESAKMAQNCFAVAKDDFFSSQMADYFKLLNLQAEMEEKYGEMLVDCSLRETVKRLFLANEAARAEEMQKQFKISDSQFARWKVEVLAQLSKWQELETWSKSRNFPVSTRALVEIYVDHEKFAEARKLLPRASQEDKLWILIKLGEFEEAASAALQRNDEKSLNRILSLCVIKKSPCHAAVQAMRDRYYSSKRGNK
ncbi:hypothetical protein M514_09917 [Trichuris suis]|uniref:Vacuolar protein sorting-associated protein 16 homolog n=1 Tax=Trichuris suis TaxID=68888 RepID=A0A085N4D0_9BILA|nr:hypothetical protein M514_09917 [Trichuris suis]